MPLFHFVKLFAKKSAISWTNNSFHMMQHYTELPDIKRVIVNTHAIEPQVCTRCFKNCPKWSRPYFLMFILLDVNLVSFQALVEFFGTLSREWALECMKDLLIVNLRGNLQIIVQVN